MTDVLFLDLPYREGTSPSFARYNAAYASVFAEILGLPKYQEGFANFPNIPLWVSSLMPIAKKHYPTVEYLRLKSCEEKVPESGIVLLSSMTSNYIYALQVAQEIKRNKPDTKIVLGGPHATVAPEICAETGLFDVVVYGEGEETLEEIFGLWKRKQSVSENVMGTCFLANGEARKAPPRLAADLNTRPLPDYTFVSPEMRETITEGAAFASKGCVWRCVYCAENSATIRTKTPERMREELSHLLTIFPRTRFLRFADSAFTARKDIRDISEEIGKVGIPWSCQTRVDIVNDETMSILRNNGCQIVNFGVESANASVLKAINKKINLDDVVKACETAHKHGCSVVTYWMIGLPEETQQTARETISTVSRYVRDGITDLAELCVCVPYPGTALYRNQDQFGVAIKKDRLFSRFVENDKSCMSTRALDADSIFGLWNEGLDQITEALAARKKAISPRTCQP